MKFLFSALLIVMIPFGSGFANAEGLSTRDIRRAGDDLQLLIPFSALVATVLFEDDLEGSRQLIGAFVVTKLATRTLKIATNKLRPDGSDRRSFPSGHTSSVFAGAAFIHRRYGFDYAIPAYIAASFVGYSRVRANKHDPIDVLAGAALAIGTVFTLVDPYQNSGLRPVVTQDSVGLNFGMKF